MLWKTIAVMMVFRYSALRSRLIFLCRSSMRENDRMVKTICRS
nr:MAG TPA: hypothetical protein [Caudoviricetes sp.]